jgi:hypothetical protein
MAEKMKNWLHGLLLVIVIDHCLVDPVSGRQHWRLRRW